MTVGEQIRKYRKKAGMTQKELGEQCGMYDSAIRLYETGRGSPKLETLQKIAAALEIPVIALLPDLAGQSNVTERAQRMNRLTLTDTFRLDGVALRGLRECRIAASAGGISEVTLVMDVETGLSGECLPSNG